MSKRFNPDDLLKPPRPEFDSTEERRNAYVTGILTGAVIGFIFGLLSALWMVHR